LRSTAWRLHVVKCPQADVDRLFADLEDPANTAAYRQIPSPEVAFQFAVMIGELVRYQPSGRDGCSEDALLSDDYQVCF
jgi:hypothetical protein